MPGVKRRGDGPRKSGDIKSNGGKGTGKKADRQPVIARSESEEGSDDFDDGEDLLASAIANGGDDDEAETSEGEGSSDELGQDIEMFSDEDLEGSFEDISTNDFGRDGPSTSKKSKTSLYAIPSREELNELKGASELFQSNITKLKLEEMLKEVRPQYEQTGALDYVLRHIKSCVEGIAPFAAVPLPQARKELKKRYKKGDVRIPFPQPAPSDDSPLKFAFERPAGVQMIGSWILKTATLQKDDVNVDMVVTMPSSIIQEKDHMNLRYFYKRAFYLAVLGAAITSDPSLAVRCSFTSCEDDSRRPILSVKSAQDGSSSDFTALRATIRIHLAYEQELFPVARLAPSRNCIRTDADQKGAQQPTPLYNTAVLKDGLHLPHLVYLHSVKAKCSGFADAVSLIKIWASQRALGDRTKSEKGSQRTALGSAGIGFILTMLLAHLLMGHDKSRDVASSTGVTISRLSHGFSSYQLFRGVLDFLGSHDFKIEPVFMKHVEGISSSGREKIDPQAFIDHFTAVMVDPTGTVNLLANFNEGTMGYLQSQARGTASLLKDTDQDSFDEVFLRDHSRYTFHFDDVVQVSLKHVGEEDADRVDFGSQMAAAAKQVSSTITQGLTTRHKLATVFGTGRTEWPLSQDQDASSASVDVGITYDAAQAFRLVDHGPRPEDVKASSAFKSFWGELSELRRFRDGRVVESVVWTVDGSFDRLAIPRRIVSFVLKRHHGLNVKSSDFIASALGKLLIPDVKAAESAYVVAPAKVGFQPLHAAFDELVKNLRSLKDLPLELISVVACDAAVRSTSAVIPGATNMHVTPPFTASYVHANGFVMTFESSGQWPDDLVAIRAMKMAFYESMAVKFVESVGGSKARIVMDVDANENKLWDSAALEIVMPSGFAFHGRIHHPREETLLQRILDDKTETEYNKSDARSALERYDERFIHAVRHHNQIAALVHHFPSFGEACRLLKRFLNAQMFGNQVAEELVELLVAAVYIDCQRSSDAPATGHLGFLKSLHTLAEWNWREEPLAIPMTAATSAVPTFTMNGKKRRAIDGNFAQIRKMDMGMRHFVWFIATEEDTKGVCWAAHHGPSTGTADGLQRLAKAACQILGQGSSLPPSHVKGLFLPSLGHFDFVIRMEPAAITRYIDNVAFDAEALKASEKRNGAVRQIATRFTATQDGPTVDLNTGLQFVNLLQSLYADSFRLYYDTLGGTMIGGIFNPTLLNPRPFRVGLGFNSTPSGEQSGLSKDVVLNRSALMEEIRRLGSDLVYDVTLQAR